MTFDITKMTDEEFWQHLAKLFKDPSLAKIKGGKGWLNGTAIIDLTMK